ncbi:RICIN domain-containing protein [Promicromonospora iranensis]|uniref:RICIN domain-containing protein n=1 Tax=Promicromonospora iranensis TaxID=1105144 RepID=UPI0023A9DFB5|nr:RICIN domain-containing protein [Promicromonospora iranensis]
MTRTTRTGSIRTTLATLSVLAVGAVGIGPAAAPAAAAPTTAHVWVTTADGSRKLADGGNLSFDTGPQPVDIRVNPGQVAQRFTGAGASVTEASAALIGNLPAGTRDSLLRSLFSRAGDGIGLNYLRQPLGSTDFNSGGFYTYEDTPGQFSIARDQQQILPVLRQALAINPGIRFMGSPWTAPAWMKTGGSLNGGSLRAENYDEYADYLVRAIQAYAQQGVPLSDLTVQNEPLFATSYPSMSMSAAEQAEFFRVLDGALTRAGLGTQLFAYDHNWDRPDYPLEVFAGTQGISRVTGAAFHCYGGSPEAQAQIVAAGKRVYFTECSGTDSENAAGTFGDTLVWHAENLVVRNMRNGGETVINWNLALDQNGGPHQGHCGTRCNGVVEIAGGTVTRNAEFYTLGHLSKFVDAGARRIGSTSEQPGGLQNVVLQNPDGTRVAYVVNASSGSRTFSITDEGRSLTHTLPGRAVATYTWDPQSTTVPADPDPAAWYQVASAASGKCLDAAGWGTTDGTGLQQWACGDAGQANQRWRFTPTSGGYYQVLSQHAGKVWDVAGGSGAVAHGTSVHLWSYVGGTNQQWRPTATGAGLSFTARHSDLCLTLGTATGTDGTRFTQQPCTGATAQVFRLGRVG